MKCRNLAKLGEKAPVGKECVCCVCVVDVLMGELGDKVGEGAFCLISEHTSGLFEYFTMSIE